VVRRASSIGKRQFRVGELLAVVDLEPGLSMNYVVDAVRDGLAGVE
jgi:hypothetical protein